MLIDTIEPNNLTHYPDKKHKPISLVTYQYISGKGERAIFNKYFGEFLQKN